jgi:hypothetical protein
MTRRPLKTRLRLEAALRRRRIAARGEKLAAQREVDRAMLAALRLDVRRVRRAEDAR